MGSSCGMQREFYPARLKVFGKALDAVTGVEALTRGLPRRWSCVVSQLRRATLSIGGNITEGAMEFSLKEQKRFYRIAKRSAGESLFYLAAMHRLKLGSPAAVRAQAKLTLEIIAMLTPMITGKKTRASQPAQAEQPQQE